MQRVLGAALALCWLWVGVARAQPTVRVRAASHLQLQIAGEGGARALHGFLLDDTDGPIARRRLDLTWSDDNAAALGEGQSARTADDGGFNVELPVRFERGRVRASFVGDGAFAASDAELAVDPKKLGVRLRFLQPRDARVELDAEQAEIVVLARSEIGGARLPIEIRDERGTLLGRGRSAEDGALELRVPARSLGPPGMGRLVAQTDGDQLRSAARAEAVIARFARTRVTLEARPEPGRARLELRGSLTALGHGLAHQALQLTDESKALATVLTDDTGRFVYRGVRLAEPHEAKQHLGVRARFVSAAPWLGSSASPVVDVSLAAPTPPSTLWLLLPLLACALVVARLSRRGGTRNADGRDWSATRSAGIHVGAASPRGAPTRNDVAGCVFDALSGRRIAGAWIRLTSAGREVELQAAASDASFACGELAPGRWQLRVWAPAYRGIEGEFIVPHAGEWSNIQVGLQSLRTEALLAYKPAAVRALTVPELWEVSTPRETLESARRSGRATESFVQLTERVEHAAYAAPSPTEADIASIADEARALVDSER